MKIDEIVSIHNDARVLAAKLLGFETYDWSLETTAQVIAVIIAADEKLESEEEHEPEHRKQKREKKHR